MLEDRGVGGEPLEGLFRSTLEAHARLLTEEAFRASGGALPSEGRLALLEGEVTDARARREALKLAPPEQWQAAHAALVEEMGLNAPAHWGVVAQAKQREAQVELLTAQLRLLREEAEVKLFEVTVASVLEELEGGRNDGDRH